jgi:hypothetical protein
VSAVLWYSYGLHSVQFRELVNISSWIRLVDAWSDVILGFCCSGIACFLFFISRSFYLRWCCPSTASFLVSGRAGLAQSI